jgi:hypothetical protein
LSCSAVGLEEHNVFNFFKQLVGLQDPQQPPIRRRTKRRQVTIDPTEPIPTPEVVEGNEHTDWDLWEDSVNSLDSRMQSITPSARIYSRSPPSQFDDGDPFSKVGKNRDL